MKKLLCLLLHCVASLCAADRPNIVLIVADDLGLGDVGCYGATRVKTPHLDRLAREGMRATGAFASASVCTPSRYGMLTGRDYWRVRSDWKGELLVEADRPTVASVLRSAGYATGYFGKWHLGWGHLDPAHPRAHRSDWDWNAARLVPGVLECGYDTFFGTPFSANEPPLVFVEDRAVYGRDPADPIQILDSRQEKYFGYGTSRGAQKAHAARPLERIDGLIAERAAAFIQQNRARPFHLQVAFVAPHVPVAPAAEFKGRSTLGPYGDFIEQLDVAVGRVLAALDAAGVSERTLVVFTSDNGAILTPAVWRTGHRSNLGRLGQKTDAWAGGLNVPFLVRWPGRIPAGSGSDELISLNDLFATTCAAAGVAVPPGAAEDSVNQLPLLTNPSAAGPRSEMVWLGISPPQVALRRGQWLFLPGIGSFGVTTDPSMAWAMQFGELGAVNSDYSASGERVPGAPPVQLYDLKADPGQARNVAAEHPDRVRGMARDLARMTGRRIDRVP